MNKILAVSLFFLASVPAGAYKAGDVIPCDPPTDYAGTCRWRRLCRRFGMGVIMRLLTVMLSIFFLCQSPVAASGRRKGITPKTTYLQASPQSTTENWDVGSATSSGDFPLGVLFNGGVGITIGDKTAGDKTAPHEGKGASALGAGSVSKAGRALKPIGAGSSIPGSCHNGTGYGSILTYPLPPGFMGPQAVAALKSPNNCNPGYGHIRDFYGGYGGISFTSDIPGVVGWINSVQGSVSRGPQVYLVDKSGQLCGEAIGTEVATINFIFTKDGTFPKCAFSDKRFLSHGPFEGSNNIPQYFIPLKVGESYLAIPNLSLPNGQAGQYRSQIMCNDSPLFADILSCDGN